MMLELKTVVRSVGFVQPGECPALLMRYIVWVQIPLAPEEKYLREDLALLAEIVYIIYMKERVARAKVAEKEVQFLYELCCSCEK